MELNTDIPRMLAVLQLDNLHTFTPVVLAHEVEATLGEALNVIRIDFITVTVALQDLASFTIHLAELAPLGALLEQSRADAEPHGATKVRLAAFRHKNDNGIGGVSGDFDGMSIYKKKISNYSDP